MPFVKKVNQSSPVEDKNVEKPLNKEVSGGKHKAPSLASSGEFNADARWVPLEKIEEHPHFRNPRGEQFPFTFNMFEKAPKITDIPGFKKLPGSRGVGESNNRPIFDEVIGELDLNSSGERSDILSDHLDKAYKYLNDNYPEILGSEKFIKDTWEQLIFDALTIRRMDELEQPIKLVEQRMGSKYITKEGHRRVCMHLLLGHSHILSIIADDNINDEIDWTKGQLRADQKEKLKESQLVLSLWKLFHEHAKKGETFGAADIVRNTRLNDRSAYIYLAAVKACDLFSDMEDNPIVAAMSSGVLKIRHFNSTGDFQFPVKEMKAGNKKPCLDFIQSLEGDAPAFVIKQKKNESNAQDYKVRIKDANKLIQISPKDGANDFMYWMLSKVIESTPELKECLPKDIYTAEGLLESVEAIDKRRRDY
jgi:hypothetical protein